MDRRVTGVTLLALGIVLSLLGTFSHDWFSMGDGDEKVALGLREIEACRGGRCESISLKDTPVDSLFSMSGNVAFFGALLGGVLGLVAGGLALARVTVTGQVSPSRLAAAFYGATLLAGLAFVSSKPELLGGLAVGMAPLLALGGAALGGIGTLLLALEDHRQRTVGPTSLPTALPRAVIANPAPTAAAAEMTPACPQCQAPLDWQAAHGRWFCAACKAYPRA